MMCDLFAAGVGSHSNDANPIATMPANNVLSSGVSSSAGSNSTNWSRGEKEVVKDATGLVVKIIKICFMCLLLHGYLSYLSQRLFSSCKATCHVFLNVNACCDVYEFQSRLSSDDETPLCNECDDEYGQWNGKVPWTNGAVKFTIGFLCRICYNVWMLGKFSAKYGNLQAYKDKIDSEKRGGESAVTHHEFMESRRNSLICACVHHLLPKPILVCVCICVFVSVCAMLSIYPSGRTSSSKNSKPRARTAAHTLVSGPTVEVASMR